MGAQDTFSMAEDFKALTGVESFMMVWDESFLSWQYYNVRGQPTAILVDPTGSPIKGWSGRFPEGEVIELASEFT